MLFILICKDKPGQLDLRMATRPKHIEYLDGLKQAGTLKFAGPFIGDDGKPLGSLLAVEAADRAEAAKLAAGDPYAQAGLFATTDIQAWNWTYGAPEAR